MKEEIVIKTGVWDLVSQAGPVVQFVMVILFIQSIICWSIMGIKHIKIKKANKDNSDFLNLFWKSKSLDHIYSKTDEYSFSPVAVVFKSGYKELQKLSATERHGSGTDEITNIQRALGRATTTEITSLEKHIGFLATTASAAPFIGLFGTVWGIMNSFQDIGAQGSANLAVVAPGISEALIATALGLFAAIPAVVAYNQFSNRIRHLGVDMDCFSQDFLNIISRGFMGSPKK